MSRFLEPAEFAKRFIEALGGRDAAQEALDREHREVSRRWNYEPEPIGRILRGHLFVEHYLTEYIRIRNPNLGNLESARLNFIQKVALAENPDAPEFPWFAGIRLLNSIRNRMSHRLNAEITDTERDAFLAIDLFRSLREALEAPRAPSMEPVDVLEEFSRSCGLILASAASPIAQVWLQAMRESSPGNTAPP